MDKVNKALGKLSDKDRENILAAFRLVVLGQLEGLNIKKLKGHKDLYRLRVGNNRLVYRHIPGQKPGIIFIGKRDDQIYRDY
jgi:mRNA-degrading endonuclease RelE of RelBE toxin-antitoxin system